MKAVAAINTSERILFAGRSMAISVEYEITSIILLGLSHVKLDSPLTGWIKSEFRGYCGNFFGYFSPVLKLQE